MNYDLVTQMINQALADTHTSAVAKITAVNGNTINAQPVVARVVDGKEIPLPVFINIPVIVLQGGGSYLAMPVSAGDYCLLIFAERCLDNWYAGSDNVSPLEDRMHDYSDGFALVGVNTGSSLIPIPSVITQIGDAFASGDHKYVGEHEYTGDHVYTGDMIVNGDYTINGNLTVTGTISAGNFSGLGGGAMTSNTDIITTKDVVASGVSLNSHTHGGVETGGGNTGGPS